MKILPMFCATTSSRSSDLPHHARRSHARRRRDHRQGDHRNVRAQRHHADANFAAIEPPLLSDFELVLSGMEGSESLRAAPLEIHQGHVVRLYEPSDQRGHEQKAGRLFRARHGRRSEAGRDVHHHAPHLERVRKELRKRLLVIDEAWWMMRSRRYRVLSLRHRKARAQILPRHLHDYAGRLRLPQFSLWRPDDYQLLDSNPFAPIADIGRSRAANIQTLRRRKISAARIDVGRASSSRASNTSRSKSSLRTRKIRSLRPTLANSRRSKKPNASATATIAPSELDLLVDSDSYVPPFYRGRALPSAGTTLHLQAIAHFKDKSGAMVPDTAITYTWKRNGSNVASSGLGKSTAVLPAPVLFGSDTISLIAQTSGGQTAQTSITIGSQEPILLLYEDHPLFGIMYERALPSRTTIADSEMTFAATAYFAQIVGPNDPRLTYSWMVNRSAIKTNPTDPSEITINADNSTGIARIDLSLSHSTNIFMDAQGSWGITFQKISGVSGDPFHSN
jgi:hypothetical protein